MKTLFAFLLLALPAAAQVPTQYSVEATLKEDRDEKTGRPVFVCSGTTNLPDGSLLSTHLYYGEVSPGRDLRYGAVKVQAGTFSVSLPVFLQRTLSGTYVAHVLFNPYLQQRVVRTTMGDQVREYQVSATLRVGDGNAVREDRKRVHLDLARKIDALWNVGQELRSLVARDPSRDAWQQEVEKWRETVRKTVEACHDVAEYKALAIADISGEAVEDLSQGLHQLIDAAGAYLGDRDNAEYPATMARLFRILDIIRHDCRRRLGLAFANAVERKRLLDTAREGILMTGGLYSWLRKDPKATTVVFRARLEEFQKEYARQVELLLDGIPRKHHELVRGLQERARTLFEIVEKAPGAKVDPTQNIRAAVDAYLEYDEPLEARLKD